MKGKYLFLSLFFMCLFNLSLCAKDIAGFWKTINEKTHKPESIIAIYEYQDKFYGRIVSVYNQEGKIETIADSIKEIAPGVKGNLPYVGMDMIWDLQKEGDKYKNGKILDPEKGKVYDSEAWLENGNLVVRGKILMFGKNQTWLPATEQDFPSDYKKIDLTHLEPVIPEIKE